MREVFLLSWVLITGWCVCLAAGLASDNWITPNDPAFRRFPEDPHQENLYLLNMERAWQIEKGSPQLVIGIIDLAFDPNHPDLKNKLWTNPKEIPGNGKDEDGNGYTEDLHGWDFLDNDGTLGGEQQEHGTHVAGIIGAETNNGIGVAGMAPNCRLMLVKVGVPGCLRDGNLQARAIRYCVDNGARIICMNHGLSEHYPGWHVPVTGVLKEACDYAYKKGVLVISGTSSNDGLFYPAVFQTAYDSVMGTGASDLFGKPSGIYGGSFFCEVIAPGGERVGGDSHDKRSVYSCYAGDRQYHYYAGGCMANPHVVGLMALVLSHYPGIDVEQARQIVRNTARSQKGQGFDVRWGHGLLQPVAALSLRRDQIAARPHLVDDRVIAGVDEEGERVYVVKVRNSGVLDAQIRASLHRGNRKVAGRLAKAVGLETTDVSFRADGLPPAADLTARIAALGVDRPRVFSSTPDIRLQVSDEDLEVRKRKSGLEVLAVTVHNEGGVEAGRVVVIVHEHEPSVPNRLGPASRMVTAKVLQVPAHGSAEAEFPVNDLPVLRNLWVEIEDLEVGAPHVERVDGKARYREGSTSPVPVDPIPAMTITRFRLDSGKGEEVRSSSGHVLTGKITAVRWTTDGADSCLQFDGNRTAVEVPDHPCLSGMKSLQVTVRVKWDGATTALEPLVYKWLAGGRNASFGLAVLNGHPYCLLQTDGSGYTETVCEDLRVTPGLWHTVSLLYTGAYLTAVLDGKESSACVPAAGLVSRCDQPLRLGAASDKTGRLAAFLSGKLSDVEIGTPEVKAPDTRIPGEFCVNDAVHVLRPGRAETFYLTMREPGVCRIEVSFCEGIGDKGLDLCVDGSSSAVTREQPAWEGRLEIGMHSLRLKASQRVAYRLEVTGVEDVWQRTFHATDRGAGAQADYYAWLAAPSPGKHALELYDCSEGAVMLLSADGKTVETITQTGGVMGDSSVEMGGVKTWRSHPYTAGNAPSGAWLCYPSRINASGDYSIRGDFTLHWRCPPEAVRQRFEQSPAMRLLRFQTRGKEVSDRDPLARYTEAAEAGLRFMEALTQEVPNGYKIHERWYVDTDAPRPYWGFDGQMLCARTYYQAYLLTKVERFRDMALGIAHRVVGYQNLDPQAYRYGALPYGLVGEKEEVSWGSSNNIQGKILYGLAQLASWTGDGQLLKALKLNADYFARMQYDSGRWPHHVERRPESVCGYDAAWGVAGLLLAFQKLREDAYLGSAERGLAAYLKGKQTDGSFHSYCTHGGGEKEDDHAIRASLTMLTPFSLAYVITKKPDYRRTLDDLYRFLYSHQDKSGVIKYREMDCVNLIYAQNWGLQGFCEAYEATGDQKYRRAAVKLADFFARVQLKDDDPHYDGAWVGSYNVAKSFPGGIVDEEGNCYDLYTSWGAGPIVYGLQRLVNLILTKQQ